MKKKFLFIIGLFILSISLFGCGNMNTPRKKVEMLLMSYRNNGESIVSELNDYLSTLMIEDAYFEDYKKVYLRQYQDLTYEIKDERIDGDNATVTAQIEVYDYYKTENDVNDYITNNPDEFLNDGKSSILYRIEELNKENSRVTYTLDINLTKVNDEWTIDTLTDDDLAKIHGTYIH